MILGSLDLSRAYTYLCNTVRLKGKSIFPLRETQINSNSIACVRDCSENPRRDCSVKPARTPS
nr:MAG TPA: hypothetical protein [Microviridae sp.]